MRELAALMFALLVMFGAAVLLSADAANMRFPGDTLDTSISIEDRSAEPLWECSAGDGWVSLVANGTWETTPTRPSLPCP